MSEERKRVLEMLAQGKITAEEAERLLEKIEARASSEGDDSSTNGSHRTAVPTFLRVVVESVDGDQVNIRVPLALVRTGIKLTTMLPSEASEKIRDAGIDLSQLSELQGDELMKALEELRVDVDSSDGDKVRIFCE